jgi:2-dehydro-3-deoxyphosphogluconate aldolase/(4S)-4-hydroxy-2-oxoglutarate aldolase
MTGDVFEGLARARIVPVVEITNVARGVELARTLLDAGLPVMEVTLRTPAALGAIRAISADVPGFVVGAGTLLAPAQFDQVAQAGAHFAVSPGFTPELSSAALNVGLPFVPGAVTATEILSAADSGHTHLKFFPAEQSGGAATIGALAAPFAALGIRFMPTGGIRSVGLNAYLALPNVFAIGGTWIAPRAAIEEGRFGTIAGAARAAVSAAAAFRATAQAEVTP